MSYIVYQVGSTAKIKEFATAAGAKRSATAMNRNAGAVKYAVAHFTYYDTFVVTKKTVKNLMTGQALWKLIPILLGVATLRQKHTGACDMAYHVRKTSNTIKHTALAQV
jgi:hypothetical protein